MPLENLTLPVSAILPGFAQGCIALQFPNGHLCRSHRFKQVQPVLVLIGITTMAILFSPNRLNQSDTLIITERVLRHAATRCHRLNTAIGVLHHHSLLLQNN